MKNFESKTELFEKQYPDDAPRFRQQLDTMKQLLSFREGRYKQVQAELKNFASAIDRAKAMWDMSQAAQQMNKLAGRQASDTFEQIKTDVAVDSVMRSVNKAFSEMETSLMDNPEVKQAQQQAVMNAPHAPGFDATTPRNCRRNNNNFLQARNHEKLLGAIAFLVVLVGVWIVHQGGLSTLIPAHDAAPASTSAQGGDSGPSTQASPSSNVLPAGFTPQASALKSIAENGIVRISVQNPSEPFFGEDKGTPHGFNVEFARLLFADPSFSHGGKPVVVDTRHEVDTYPGVPKQLLDTDAKGNHVVDVAMDGLTFPDNTPSASSIRCRTSTISAIR